LWKKFYVLAVLAGVALAPMRFPEGPLVFEMQRGERASSLADCEAGDRIAIGWWSNGWKQLPVETVTWISPNMASRWFGYLNRREHWPYELLRERWDALRYRLAGRLTFVVQLCAFPKSDLLESGEDLNADEKAMCLSRALVTYRKPATRELETSDNLRTDRTDATVECELTPLGWLSSDSWRKLMEPWWLAWAPSLSALQPSPACTAPSPYDFVTGAFHTAFYLVQVRLDSELEKAAEFKLVLMGSKERVATFKR